MKSRPDTATKQKRIEWIDTAKGICILLVVANHIFTFYDFAHIYEGSYARMGDFLSSFRMPLYFFLSGLFFKRYGGLRLFMVKKTNKLLIPFLFFYAVFSVALPALIIHSGSSILNLRDTVPAPALPTLLLDFYHNDCQLINGPLWFLLCLFEVNMVFFAITSICHRLRSVCLLSLLAGFSGLALSYGHIDLPASADTALTCVPFFAFGLFTRRKTPILQASALDHYLLPCALCGFLFCFAAAGHVEFFRNMFYGYSWLTVYACGCAGTLSVMFVAKRLGHIPVVSYMGRYSIIILCTHILYLKMVVGYVLTRLTPWVGATVLLLFIIGAELLTIPFMKRYLPHVTAQKDIEWG